MIIEQTKNGILNVDKPQCITSHDVVDAIRNRRCYKAFR